MENIIVVLIFLIAVWIFEGKIFPQVIVLFLAMYEISTRISTTTQSNVVELVLLAGIVMYGAMQIYLGGQNENR